jgi:hypothetical protein
VKQIHPYTATRLVNFMVSAVKSSARSDLGAQAAEAAVKVVDAALQDDRVRGNVQLV